MSGPEGLRDRLVTPRHPTASAQRGYALLGYQRLSYLHAGQGPTLLLLHTIGGSASEYARILPALAERLTVYAVDLPGHGESYALSEHEPVPDVAETLMRFLDAVGVRRASVLGNSMSGTNALELAITHPERVEKVVLVSGVGPWSEQAGLPARPPANVGTSERKEIGWLRAQFFDPAEADRPGLFEWWASTRSVADDEMIRAWRRRPLLPRSLRECPAPTLLVIGANDPLHPAVWARAWAALLPSGQVAQIDRAKHFLNLERPHELARIVSRFVLGS